MLNRKSYLSYALLMVFGIVLLQGVVTGKGYTLWELEGDGSSVSNSGADWSTIQGMEYTLELNTTDEVLAVFIGDIVTNPLCFGDYRIEADGVPFTYDARISSESSTSTTTRTNGYELTGYYNHTGVLANVTFRVRMKAQSGKSMSATGNRQLSLMHFNASEGVEFYYTGSTTEKSASGTWAKIPSMNLTVDAVVGDKIWCIFEGNYYTGASAFGRLRLIRDKATILPIYTTRYGSNAGTTVSTRHNQQGIKVIEEVALNGTYEYTANFTTGTNFKVAGRHLIVVKFPSSSTPNSAVNDRVVGVSVSTSQAWKTVDTFEYNVTLNAGESIITTFSGNVWVSALQWCNFRVTVNGTSATDTSTRFSNYYSAGSSTYRWAVTYSAFYIAQTTGTYEVKLEWIGQNTASGNIYNQEGMFSYLAGVNATQGILGAIFTPVPTHIESIKLFDAEDNLMLNGSWMYMSEVYRLQMDVHNPTYSEVNFTDSQRDIETRYFNSTVLDVELVDYFTYFAEKKEDVIAVINGEMTILNETTVDVLVLDGVVIGTNQSYLKRLEWTFILSKNIVDNSNLLMNGNTISNANSWYTGLNDTDEWVGWLETNIYNLGGVVSYDFNSTGVKIVGGDVFELETGTATDGGAKATTIFRRLQHVHQLVELDCRSDWNSVNGDFENYTGASYEWQIDYELNGDWVKGWKIVAYVESADVGHHNAGSDKNWIDYTIEFYQHDNVLNQWNLTKTSEIITNHWGYDVATGTSGYYNRTTSQVWIDLWFNRMNSSTVVGARVSPYYLGMYEVGTAWFGYGTFKPMFGSGDVASCFFELVDTNNTVTNCYGIEKVRYSNMVYKNVPNDKNYKIMNFEVLNWKLADDRMEGIDTPPIVEALILDTPTGGFITPIVKAVENIGNIIWKGAFSFLRLVLTSLDSLLTYLGLPPVFGMLVQLFNSGYDIVIIIWEKFFVIVDYLILSITNIFTSLLLVIPRYFTLVGVLITTFVGYYNVVVSFFTGGISGIPNIWLEFNMEEVIQLALALVPIAEAVRIENSENPIGQLAEDVKLFISIITGVFDFFSKMFMLMVDIINRIASVF